METWALTAGKWILNRQLINHLPLLQIFRVENATSGTHCRSDDQAVIDGKSEFCERLFAGRGASLPWLPPAQHLLKLIASEARTSS